MRNTRWQHIYRHLRHAFVFFFLCLKAKTRDWWAIVFVDKNLFRWKILETVWCDFKISVLYDKACCCMLSQFCIIFLWTFTSIWFFLILKIFKGLFRIFFLLFLQAPCYDVCSFSLNSFFPSLCGLRLVPPHCRPVDEHRDRVCWRLCWCSHALAAALIAALIGTPGHVIVVGTHSRIRRCEHTAACGGKSAIKETAINSSPPRTAEWPAR